MAAGGYAGGCSVLLVSLPFSGAFSEGESRRYYRIWDSFSYARNEAELIGVILDHPGFSKSVQTRGEVRFLQ